MGVAPPPPVPCGVLERVRSDMRWQKAARGQFPPGELSFSMQPHAASSSASRSHCSCAYTSATGRSSRCG